MTAQYLRGSELRVGDTIEYYTDGRTDTITSLRPYVGNLAGLWGGKAQIATFAINHRGMTIEPQQVFTVTSRR
jgi:hypothetical protein